jgi:Spy/CpxP family protein refolding chaperone
MKINLRRSVTSITVASFCFAAAIAVPTFSASAAEQAPPNLFPNPMDFIGNLSRLNLSQKQMDDIQKLLKDRMPKVELTMTRAMEAERALRAAINAEPLDEKAVRRKSEDLGAVITDCAVEAARLRSDVMELLTKEQRESLLAMLKNMEQMETTASRFVDMLRLLARMAQMGQMPQLPK